MAPPRLVRRHTSYKRYDNLSRMSQWRRRKRNANQAFCDVNLFRYSSASSREAMRDVQALNEPASSGEVSDSATNQCSPKPERVETSANSNRSHSLVSDNIQDALGNSAVLETAETLEGQQEEPVGCSEINLRQVLAEWAVSETKVPKKSISRLLDRIHVFFSDLPVTYNGLLPKPQLHYEDMGDGGRYCHFPNWTAALAKFLCYHCQGLYGTKEYFLIINVDGLPLFKGSPDFKLYPILVSVYGVIMRPICAGRMRKCVASS